jgi:hypothetical protein
MRNSIKLAAAVCGLVGSISFNPNAEMEYLEDDSLFAKTTAQLVHGWEWGLSNAHADIEVICCGWLPPGWDDDYGSGGYGGSGGGGGGGGGGGNDASGNDSPEDEQPMTALERERCRASAQANYSQQFAYATARYVEVHDDICIGEGSISISANGVVVGTEVSVDLYNQCNNSAIGHRGNAIAVAAVLRDRTIQNCY